LLGVLIQVFGRDLPITGECRLSPFQFRRYDRGTPQDGGFSLADRLGAAGIGNESGIQVAATARP